MNKNIFFKKKNNISLKSICNLLHINNLSNTKIIINDIKTLDSANTRDLTFFHSSKYINLIPSIKSNYIITTKKFSKLFSKSKKLLIVKNVLVSVAKITNLFYPDSLEEVFDGNVITKLNKKKFKKIKIGSNVIIGKNATIGSNTVIGHNSIIENNVVIGKNCSIGSNVIIKKSIIGNNVLILDGAIIGKKGFGFFPDKKRILDIPT